MQVEVPYTPPGATVVINTDLIIRMQEDDDTGHCFILQRSIDRKGRTHEQELCAFCCLQQVLEAIAQKAIADHEYRKKQTVSVEHKVCVVCGKPAVVVDDGQDYCHFCYRIFPKEKHG